MKARPLSKATASALATVVLANTRARIESARRNTDMSEMTLMRVIAEDTAAQLLGAVCGDEAELELRRLFGDRRDTVASFGANLRLEAAHAELHAKQLRALRRHTPAKVKRPGRRFIDHTHPQD